MRRAILLFTIVFILSGVVYCDNLYYVKESLDVHKGKDSTSKVIYTISPNETIEAEFQLNWIKIRIPQKKGLTGYVSRESAGLLIKKEEKKQPVSSQSKNNMHFSQYSHEDIFAGRVENDYFAKNYKETTIIEHPSLTSCTWINAGLQVVSGLIIVSEPDSEIPLYISLGGLIVQFYGYIDKEEHIIIEKK